MHDVAQASLLCINHVNRKPQFLGPRELATKQGAVWKVKSRPVFSDSSTTPPQMQRERYADIQALTRMEPAGLRYCYEQERWWEERCENSKLPGLRYICCKVDDVLVLRNPLEARKLRYLT